MSTWELANEVTLATPLQGMVNTIAPLCRRTLPSNSGTRALLRDGAKKSRQAPCRESQAVVPMPPDARPGD